MRSGESLVVKQPREDATLELHGLTSHVFGVLKLETAFCFTGKH